MGIQTNHFLTCDKHASSSCPYVLSMSLEATLKDIVNSATDAGWILHNGKWLCTHCKPAIIEQFKVNMEEHGHLLIWVLSDNTIHVAHRDNDYGTWGRPFTGKPTSNE